MAFLVNLKETLGKFKGNSSLREIQVNFVNLNEILTNFDGICGEPHGLLIKTSCMTKKSSDKCHVNL